MPLDCTCIDKLCGFEFFIKKCSCCRFCGSTVNVIVAEPSAAAVEALGAIGTTLVDGGSEPLETRVQKIHADEEVQALKDSMMYHRLSFIYLRHLKKLKIYVMNKE